MKNMENDRKYENRAFELYREADELLDNLVDIRKKHHLTQKELADRMNVSQSTISNIEKGRTHLVDQLTDYALEAGARIHYTVLDDEEPEQDDAHTFTRSFTDRSDAIDQPAISEISYQNQTV